MSDESPLERAQRKLRQMKEKEDLEDDTFWEEANEKYYAKHPEASEQQEEAPLEESETELATKKAEIRKLEQTVKAKRENEIRNRKLQVLDSIEKRFQVEETLAGLADVCTKVPEFIPILGEYLSAIFIVGRGKADSFTVTVTTKHEGDLIIFQRNWKFYDASGKEIMFENFAQVLRDED